MKRKMNYMLIVIGIGIGMNAVSSKIGVTSENGVNNNEVVLKEVNLMKEGILMKEVNNKEANNKEANNNEVNNNEVNYNNNIINNKNKDMSYETPFNTYYELSNTEPADTTTHTECETEELVVFGSAKWWMYLSLAMFFVLMGGLMSGLTVGFMSIDRLKLEVLKEAGTEEEKVMAEIVQPVLENHHLLLVTLLLANATAMEALPIMLDAILPSFVAIIVSVTFVLFFGEVIPQAICTANPLKICASTCWFIKILEFVTYPIAAPVALLLDYLLGDHSAHILFKRSELTTLIHLHAQEQQGNGESGPLKSGEVNVIRGALEFSNKKVSDVMTPIDFVCMLDIDRSLDMDTLAYILSMGHSRIPVFQNSIHNIKGLLLVKRIIVCNPDAKRPVRHFVHRRPMVVPPNLPLQELLNHFQSGRSHLAIVTNHTREYQWALDSGEDVAGYCRIDGIVTLEDVVEELIKKEIEDEVDVGFAAGSRPMEREEDQTLHRFQGMVRAKIVFGNLLKRVRERLYNERVRPFVSFEIIENVDIHDKAVVSLPLQSFEMTDEGSVNFSGAESEFDLFLSNAVSKGNNISIGTLSQKVEGDKDLYVTVVSSNGSTSLHNHDFKYDDYESLSSTPRLPMKKRTASSSGRILYDPSSGKQGQIVYKKGFASTAAIVPSLSAPVARRVYSSGKNLIELSKSPEKSRSSKAQSSSKVKYSKTSHHHDKKIHSHHLDSHKSRSRVHSNEHGGDYVVNIQESADLISKSDAHILSPKQKSSLPNWLNSLPSFGGSYNMPPALNAGKNSNFNAAYSPPSSISFGPIEPTKVISPISSPKVATRNRSDSPESPLLHSETRLDQRSQAFSTLPQSGWLNVRNYSKSSIKEIPADRIDKYAVLESNNTNNSPPGILPLSKNDVYDDVQGDSI